ncbi:MAG: DUF2793 domain-containing protein, partial [Proteobacteria bacterium]|nr:DUF2793 domain-containing protein [Pseudomonadota bacterium]
MPRQPLSTPKVLPDAAPPSTAPNCSSDERLFQEIRVRQDTLANWLHNDPILKSGEFGFVIGSTDPGQTLKIGDGTLRWSQLPWLMSKGSDGAAGIQGPAGHSIQVFGPSADPPIGVPVYKGDIWLATDPSHFSPSFDPTSIVPAPGPPGPQGPAGPSAFDVWKVITGKPTAGYSDYLDAIKGATGAAGEKGPAGETLKVEGVVVDEASLPVAPPNLTVLMTTDGVLFIYNPTSAAAAANGWVNLGKLAGPAGRDAWLSAPVSDAYKLPAIGGPGQMVYVTSTGHLWGWDDARSLWVDGGKIGGGIADGTAQGQTLVWDNTNLLWQPSNSALPPASHDGDVIVWDIANAAWVARKPLLSELQDVDENATNLTQDCVLVWDAGNGQWTDSRSIGVDDIEFDASGPGTLMEGIAAQSGATFDATKDTWVPSCMAVDRYLRDVIALENLSDTKELSKAINGQVPVWSDANSRWEPGSSAASMNELTDVTLTNPQQNQVLGFDATLSQWVNVPPGASAEYVNLQIERLAVGLAADVPVMTITNDPPSPDDVMNRFLIVGTAPTAEFGSHPNDVAYYIAKADGSYGWHFRSPKVGEIHFVEDANAEYRWSGTAWEVAHEAGLATTAYVDQKYIEAASNLRHYATQSYVDTRLGQITTGLLHKVAVESIANTPPASPQVGDQYIVGTAPTGAWAGHANAVAAWAVGGSSVWTFEAPHVNDSHFVETARKTYTWNGTLWVVVSESVTANNPGELWMVGDIKQSILTETQFINELPEAERTKWCLADGRNVTGSRWAAITGQ